MDKVGNQLVLILTDRIEVAVVEDSAVATMVHAVVEEVLSMEEEEVMVETVEAEEVTEVEEADMMENVVVAAAGTKETLIDRADLQEEEEVIKIEDHDEMDRQAVDMAAVVLVQEAVNSDPMVV